MPDYRRPGIAGGTYFITQVTYQRQPCLCREVSRHALRTAIKQVRETRPFAIDGFVLLPDHFQIESARVRAFVSCIPLGSLLTANVGGVLDPVVEQSKLVQT